MTQRILVVEDDGNQLALIKAMLKNTDYQLRWAPDIQRAMELVKAQKMAIALIDVNLAADGDGISLIEWLRSESDQADLPVIVMTGNPSKDTVLRVRKAGIAGLLVKPFTQRLLMKALAASRFTTGFSTSAGTKSISRQESDRRNPSETFARDPVGPPTIDEEE